MAPALTQSNPAEAAMRRCYDCGLIKPLSAFAFHSIARATRQGRCRPCHAIYRRAHYLRNRATYVRREVARIRGYREENRRRIRDYLRTHPCVDCGESDPLVLEFDHRSEKRAGVNELMRNHGTWAEVFAEIEKCDVRCANCHRRKTASTHGYYEDLRDLTGSIVPLEARRQRWDYLLAHPCVDCGEADPIVLEFDHRGDKRAQIVDLIGDHASWPDVFAEIQQALEQVPA